MRWLLFLSRLALVCNLFFVLSLTLQFTRWFQNQDAESTIIIIGYFMALLLNPTAVFCYFFFFCINRKKLVGQPNWLMIANTLFLVFQIYFILHLNGR